MAPAPDLSGPLRVQLDRLLAEARALRKQERYAEAAQRYRQCAILQKQIAQYASSKSGKIEQLRLAQTYAETADRLERMAAPQAEPSGGGEDFSAQIAALRMHSSITWDDIGDLTETKAAIQAAYAFALVQRPAGVERRPINKILLYGPPGTGKTMLAAAASNELDATFYSVKASDLLSKWFGESPRLISALYHDAREHAPAVVFLEEFDALAPRRGGSDSGAERRIVSTLLAELDGLVDSAAQDAYVLTIAATNLPWNIDSAILSRFGARLLYVPLPDAEGRRQILEKQIMGKGYKLAFPLEELVKKTRGFSGRDLSNLVNIAIEQMEYENNPEVLELKGREALQNYQLRITPLTREHFARALKQVQPQTSPDDVAQFARWRAEMD